MVNPGFHAIFVIQCPLCRMYTLLCLSRLPGRLWTENHLAADDLPR